MQTIFGRTDQFVGEQDLPKGQPIGDHDSQVEEAMRIAKLGRRTEEGEQESFLDIMKRLEHMNVSEAVGHILALSQHERERWLKAEKLSKNRKMVLGHFGME